MKEYLKNIFRWPWFNHSEDDNDWQTPNTVLEIVNKNELDEMQEEVIKDLRAEGVLDPRALFYIYKYIDAIFDKNDFDIDSRFITKANKLDQFYSNGKAEVYAELTDYKAAMEKLKIADARLRRSIKALDPETAITDEDFKVDDDSDALNGKFNQLVDTVNWEGQ